MAAHDRRQSVDGQRSLTTTVSVDWQLPDRTFRRIVSFSDQRAVCNKRPEECRTTSGLVATVVLNCWLAPWRYASHMDSDAPDELVRLAQKGTGLCLVSSGCTGGQQSLRTRSSSRPGPGVAAGGYRH